MPKPERYNDNMMLATIATSMMMVMMMMMMMMKPYVQVATKMIVMSRW